MLAIVAVSLGNMPLTFAGRCRACATARDAAKLGDFHLHDLRHSAASFMINGGIELFTVGRILGHADHQLTMRYSHLGPLFFDALRHPNVCYWVGGGLLMDSIPSI